MKILLKALYPYIFLLLFLIIPFDNYIRAFPNILLGLLVILFPFVACLKDIKKRLYKASLLLLLFVLFLGVSAVLTGRFYMDLNNLKLMLIPLGIVFVYVPVLDFNKLNKAIIFSAFATIVFSVFQFARYSFNAHDVSLSFFQETVDALLIDRPYLGLLSIVSILISYKSLTKKYSPYNKYYLINIILNVLYIFLIMSKIAIVILIALVVLKQFYGKHKKITIPISIVAISILGVFLFNAYRTNINSYLKPQELTAQIQYNTSKMPTPYRSIIWKCTKELLAKNKTSLLGMGFKKTNKKLVNCYQNNIKDSQTKHTFVTQEFNTHNQFADLYLSGGLIGLGLFLGFLISLFVTHRKHFFKTAILMSLVLFGLTENFLHRQIGVYYFGVILIFLLINKSNPESHQE